MANTPDVKFIHEILRLHNFMRAKHSAPNLRVNEKLNKSAQKWAEVLAKYNKLQHKPNNEYGENLYVFWSSDPKFKLQPHLIINSWYDECKMYKYGEKRPKNLNEVGHFTQLVWNETKELGIGMAMSNSRNVYVVCHYYPPGNIRGQFAEHVQRPKDSRGRTHNDNQVNTEMVDFAATPSLEKLGIRPKTRPNVETIEKMRSLYNEPTERIQAWLSWLIQVAETGKKWHDWIQNNIRAVQTILMILTGDFFVIPIETLGGFQLRENELARKAKDEIVPDGDEEKSSQLRGKINRTQDEMFLVQSADKKKESLVVVDEEPPPQTQSPKATAVVNEKLNGTTVKPHQWTNEENSSEVPGTLEAFDKNPWPIGVPWDPQAFDENKKIEQNPETMELPKEMKLPIPLPKKLEENLAAKMIERIQRQATLYRSLHKHWKQITEQAYNQVVDSQIRAMKKVFADKEIPYFFYLYCPPDIDTAIQHDDEAIVWANVTRKNK